MKFQITKTQLAVALAASKDDTRYNLTGIYCHAGPSGKLRIVATNGHYLAMVDTFEDFNAESDNSGVILDAAAVKILQTWLKDKTQTHATIESVDDANTITSILLSCGAQTANVMPIFGEYPNYRQVLPAEDKPQELKQGIGLNSEYIGIASKILKAANPKGRVRPSKWEFFDELSPVRITSDTDDGKVTIIVMPMRLD